MNLDPPFGPGTLSLAPSSCGLIPSDSRHRARGANREHRQRLSGRALAGELEDLSIYNGQEQSVLLCDLLQEPAARPRTVRLRDLPVTG